MIQINATKTKKSKRLKNVLFVDGKPVSTNQCRVGGSSNQATIHVHKELLGNQLKSLRFGNLPKKLVKLSFPCTFAWAPIDRTTIWRKEDGKFEISYSFVVAWSKWKQLWTVQEYLNVLKDVVKSTSSDRREFRIVKTDLFLKLQPAKSAIIQDEIGRTIQIVREMHDKATRVLKSRIRDRSLILTFDFPQSVKVPCEQYLLYFVQFLADLGIEADAAIHHQPAGDILFSVTPKQKEEALHNIKRALEIYLRLPSNPDISSVKTNDIHFQQLIANVHHLKGQLALAGAMLQAKDISIGSLVDANIQLQRKLLSGEVMMDSLKTKDASPNAKDKEELLDGMVAITTYEGKGFEIYGAEIFRRLRKLLFGKD